MKINDILPHQTGTAKTGKTSGTTAGISFQDVLRSQVQATGPVDAMSAVSPVRQVSGIAPGLRLEGLELTEHALGTLESLSTALGNPAFSAEALEPYAAALEDDTAALVSLKNQLPAEDPLAALLERVATVSFVEAAKFRRGDYHA